ncbi:uncharacterized protein BDW43DRAFT_264129 [Aspergillus alliaceus]|uniref:uncharacterized protein n=1 Tax=Petromyces alliaceus TaxID=209559 RepID=UPI0012A5B994|nr:uncharacterized protein BDW43DRAFT_264129 [Aspergillus alliaceus]KAB8237760.1 hypothetical protein BDW43DRAFT_264129 [Aspergillus alliaceus]
MTTNPTLNSILLSATGCSIIILFLFDSTFFSLSALHFKTRSGTSLCFCCYFQDRSSSEDRNIGRPFFPFKGATGTKGPDIRSSPSTLLRSPCSW